MVYNDIKFDSIYERDRYIYLVELQKQGLISQLRLKTKFTIIAPTIKYVPIQLKTKVKYVNKVVEQARLKNIKIVPICSYAKKVMEGKEEYKSVL